MFRRFERTKLDLYINKIVGDEPYLVRVRDISAGGLYLHTLLEPEADHGAEIGLEMQLPNSEDIIWAVGEVVRAVDGSQAIKFKRIAESDRGLIQAYVDGRRQQGRTEAAA